MIKNWRLKTVRTMSTFPVGLLRISQGWRGDVAALFAGVLGPLAFAPLSLWPLAIVSLIILFLVWLPASPKRAAVRGFIFGFGFFAVGIHWIFISVYYHGFVNIGLSLFLTALLMAYMALFPMLLGYLLQRYSAKGFSAQTTRFKLLILFPSAWVLMECLRGWLFTGFPWLAMGYSQTDTWLAGIAPLFGVYGISWVVAVSAALLLALFMDKTGRFYALPLLALLWFSAWVSQQQEWTEPVGEPITVALLQGNIPQDMKWNPDMRRPTIELYTELTRQNWAADLVVWPETALPAFYYEVEPFLADLEQEARDNDTDLLIGMLSFAEDRRSYYNTMMALGEERGEYHKNHLVPFTEYLPLKSILGALVNFMQVPMSDFSKGGTEQKPLKVAGQWAGISICFEDAFGEEVVGALPKATFLVNVSNDAWFDDSWAPPQHLQMARMRAIESGRPLLRATNTGMTAVIDRDGRLMAQAPQFEVASLVETIQPRQGSTLYAMTGNSVLLLLNFIAIGFAFFLFRKEQLSVFKNDG